MKSPRNYFKPPVRALMLLIACLFFAAHNPCIAAPGLAFQQHPSPNFDDRKVESTIDTIVLHATATASRRQALTILSHKNSGLSAHYLIDRVGTIYRLVAEEKRAWHVGESRMPDGRENVNDFSIGIELVNRNDGREMYSHDQLRAVRLLISDISTRWPIKHIVTHAAISFPAGRKTDPRGFDMEWLKDP